MCGRFFNAKDLSELASPVDFVCRDFSDRMTE
jgi:hypothetical protein